MYLRVSIPLFKVGVQRKANRTGHVVTSPSAYADVHFNALLVRTWLIARVTVSQRPSVAHASHGTLEIDRVRERE